MFMVRRNQISYKSMNIFDKTKTKNKQTNKNRKTKQNNNNNNSYSNKTSYKQPFGLFGLVNKKK